MPAEKVIIDVVAHIYHAAVDPNCWPPLLQDFADATQSEAAAVFLRQNDETLLLDTSCGISSGDRRSCASHYAEVNV
jgi:hypothetical protein